MADKFDKISRINLTQVPLEMRPHIGGYFTDEDMHNPQQGVLLVPCPGQDLEAGTVVRCTKRYSGGLTIGDAAFCQPFIMGGRAAAKYTKRPSAFDILRHYSIAKEKIGQHDVLWERALCVVDEQRKSGTSMWGNRDLSVYEIPVIKNSTEGWYLVTAGNRLGVTQDLAHNPQLPLEAFLKWVELGVRPATPKPEARTTDLLLIDEAPTLREAWGTAYLAAADFRKYVKTLEKLDKSLTWTSGLSLSDYSLPRSAAYVRINGAGCLMYTSRITPKSDIIKAEDLIKQCIPQSAFEAALRGVKKGLEKHRKDAGHEHMKSALFPFVPRPKGLVSYKDLATPPKFFNPSIVSMLREPNFKLITNPKEATMPKLFEKRVFISGHDAAVQSADSIMTEIDKATNRLRTMKSAQESQPMKARDKQIKQLEKEIAKAVEWLDSQS